MTDRRHTYEKTDPVDASYAVRRITESYAYILFNVGDDDIGTTLNEIYDAMLAHLPTTTWELKQAQTLLLAVKFHPSVVTRYRVGAIKPDLTYITTIGCIIEKERVDRGHKYVLVHLRPLIKKHAVIDSREASFLGFERDLLRERRELISRRHRGFRRAAIPGNEHLEGVAQMVLVLASLLAMFEHHDMYDSYPSRGPPAQPDYRRAHHARMAIKTVECAADLDTVAAMARAAMAWFDETLARADRGHGPYRPILLEPAPTE